MLIFSSKKKKKQQGFLFLYKIYLPFFLLNYLKPMGATAEVFLNMAVRTAGSKIKIIME